MNKILSIMKREYLTRVKKKSFIIMTILIPILMGLLMVFPILMSQFKSGKTTVVILDESGLFRNKINNTDNIFFQYKDDDLETAKTMYDNPILHIPEIDIYRPIGIRFYAQNQVGLAIKSYIERQMEKEIERLRLQDEGLSHDYLEKLKVNINLETIIISEEGEKSGNTEIAAGLSYVMGFILYIMILSYGTLISKGVAEEKKNRIVEIVISSVRPFQLMLGKILGIAAVALTQIIIWIILGTIIFTIITLSFMPEMMDMQQGNLPNGMQNVQSESEMTHIIEGLHSLNMPVIITLFLFFFMFGYLLYSAFFAAIGAISDEVSENQAITMPVILPIILSFFIMIHVLEQPNSPLAVWTSLFPLFSPIVMMTRVPFSVPIWQLAISMVLLVLTFIAAVWFSGKVYRTAILLYGKKITMKEIWKWIIHS